jgi:hypothetical protein
MLVAKHRLDPRLAVSESNQTPRLGVYGGQWLRAGATRPCELPADGLFHR